MTITHSICRSFFTELFAGTHVFGTDTLKLALYQNSAAIGPDTTAYTATGECTGAGYSAGGNAVALASGFPKLNTVAQGGIAAGRALLVDFNDTVFSGVTLVARGALLYNASKSNKAIVAIDFGQVFSPIAQSLTIPYPAPDALNALIRIIAQE